MAKNPKRPRDPNQLAKFITDVIGGDKPKDKQKAPKNPQRKGSVSKAKKRENK